LTSASPIDDEISLSGLLRSLARDDSPPSDSTSIVATAGNRVHGLVLFLLVLPELPPLPLPSVSAILGMPLLLISTHLAWFGDRARLPSRLVSSRFQRSVLQRSSRLLIPVVQWIERHSLERWSWLVRPRLVGLLCAYLSLVLLLPIPLMNSPPAWCLALLAVGLVRRDGLLIAIGVCGAAVLTAVLTVVTVRLEALILG
jgi:hypothetical protein